MRHRRKSLWHCYCLDQDEHMLISYLVLSIFCNKMKRYQHADLTSCWLMTNIECYLCTTFSIVVKNILCFVEKIHARNIKCIPFFTPLPSFLFLVVSCFCAACLREEFGGWGPFYLIADLRVFSVWCMLAWKFIFSTKHCTIFAGCNLCSPDMHAETRKYLFRCMCFLKKVV